MPVVYLLAAGYFFGLMAAARLPYGPAVALALAAASVAAAFVLQKRSDKVFMGALCAAAFFTASFVMKADHAAFLRAPVSRYISSIKNDSETRRLHGVVATQPERSGRRVRFEMKVERAGEGRGFRCPGRVAVSVRVPDDYLEGKKAAVIPPGMPRRGDRIIAEGRLSGIEWLDRDVQSYYMAKDVAGFLFAGSADALQQDGRGRVFSLFGWGDALRGRFARAIQKGMGEPYAAITGRMLLGKGVGIPEDIEDAFRDTGVIHVLVVSGFHVAALLGVFLMLAFFWRYNRWVTVGVVGAVLIVFYAMTGGGASVSRAVIMGFVLVASLTVRRDYDPLTALCLAGLLLMAANPNVVHNLGAQLSFLACLGILVIYPQLRALVPVWMHPYAQKGIRSVLVSLSAQLPLYPLIAYQFNAVSLVSPFSNLIVAPLSALAIPLGMLLCAFGAVWDGFAAVFGPPVQAVVWLMLLFVRLFDAVPFASVKVASPTVLTLALYAVFAGGAVMAAKAYAERRRATLNWGLVAAGVAGCLLAWSFLFELPQRDARLTFIDVGEGDAALIEAPCGRGGVPVRALVDGGGGIAVRGGYDPAERVLGRSLIRRGVRSLDLVVLTHADADHLNGLLWVLRNMRVGAVADTGIDPGEESYKLFREEIRKRNIKYIRAAEGEQAKLGCATLEFISPPRRLLPLGEKMPNEMSLSFMLRYGDKKALFTGDIEEFAEEYLSSARGGKLRCDVLKVSHHGSGNSTTWPFLSAARPKMAVISAGRGNFYGHPSRYTLNRLRYYGTKVYRTDTQGDVEMILPPRGKVRVKTEFE